MDILTSTLGLGMPALIDLSHRIEAGMITYPGLPGPVISAHMSRKESRAHYAEGVEFHIGRIDMVGNTGTYLDAPFHRAPDGDDVADLPLEVLADLPGVVVKPDLSGTRAVGPEAWDGLEVAGLAVLVETGWSRHWGMDAYFSGHPYLTRRGAESLVEAGPALVGVDSLNIDSTDDPTRPAHSLLLGAGIPIVEHLTGLDRLPQGGFRFFAAPVAVTGLGSFPVRAFALVP